MRPRFVITYAFVSLLFLAVRLQAQSSFQYDSNGNLTNVTAAIEGAPVITASPTTQSVYIGEDAGFGVLASGSEPMSYQWYDNGVLMQGATNSTLFLKNTTPADQGSYSVVVYNADGCVTSTVPALLEFNWTWVASGPADWFSPSSWQPAIIPTGLENITIPAGATINLSAPVTISGSLTCYGGTINSNSLSISSNGLFNVIGGNLNLQSQMLATDASVNVSNGGVLSVSNSWVNGGSVGLTISSGGTLNLAGTLMNSNAILLVSGAQGSLVMDGGSVIGGAVLMTNGASLLVDGSVTFNGVAVNGTLDVGNTYNGAQLAVTNGLTLNGTCYVGSPTNTAVDGNWGGLVFAGSQSLNGNGTVILGYASGCNGIEGSGANAVFLSVAGTTLTIGPGIIIEGKNGTVGAATTCPWNGPSNVSVDNQGTVEASVNGGNITVNAQPFDNSGTVAATLGTVSLAGSYNLASGVLEFGLSNTSSFGKINISGNATLAGIVDATLLNGFLPALSNSFAVLTYASRTGIFTNTVLPSTTVWQTNYGPTSFTLTVLGSRPILIPLVLANEAQEQSGFLLQFASGSNYDYTVLASTNLTIPLSNWFNLGVPFLLSNNIYEFIDTQNTNFPMRFYILQSP